MTRVAVSVEGQTEEEFVKNVLADHLRGRHVEATPILVGRSRGKSGGGNVSVHRLASDMAMLFRGFDFVTSLVDFYGFVGKGDSSPAELEERIHDAVCDKLTGNWDQSRVFPYVQKHEFEGLLFSNVEVFQTLIDLPEESIQELRRIREAFPTPEDINDNTATAPSKRIASIIPRYDKVLYGSIVAMDTELDVIRDACPRFGNWLGRLESLGR